jgi:hypothetical protein
LLRLRCVEWQESKRKGRKWLEGGSDIEGGGRGNANMNVGYCATYAYAYTDLYIMLVWVGWPVLSTDRGAFVSRLTF